jgi:Fe2+ transport system protein A
MTLDLVKPGYTAVLRTIGGEGALRHRLLDMGLTPKTRITVRKVAPMGDPIEIFLRGYVLTLREEDAANISVEEVEKV